MLPMLLEGVNFTRNERMDEGSFIMDDTIIVILKHETVFIIISFIENTLHNE